MAADRRSFRLPPALDAFLARETRAFLLTLRADGSPTAHPMTAIYADGTLTFNTYRKSAKARNAERDDRVCCVVVDGYEASEPRGVLVRGRARTRPAAEMATPAAADARAPEVSQSVVDRVAERVSSGKRVLLDVVPEEALPLDLGRTGDR